jgi:hypothetical protein
VARISARTSADRPGTDRAGSGACAVLRIVLLACLTLAAASALGAGSRPALEREIRSLTLTAAGKDAGTLTADTRLRAIARDHSANMYQQRQLGHVLADGTGPGERVARGHRSLFALIAENVAYQKNWPRDTELAERFVQSWLDSPGHRRNIMASYDALEIGCHGDRTLMYCTQLFASAASRTTNDIPFRLPPGGTVAVRLEPPPHSLSPAGGHTTTPPRRVSITAAGERPQDLGVPLDGRAARLPLPTTPGLYELHLWTREGDNPPRYGIVGGPFVCVTRARTTVPDCGM